MSFKLYHIPVDRLRSFIIEQRELTFSERLHISECPDCISNMANAVLQQISSRNTNVSAA